jgi:hypothetical protein
LKTAPATFQKRMNSAMSGLTGTRCFVYLDDIVIYAKSLSDHNVKLREVLERLRTHRLKLQPDKCEFLRKEFNYLGHQITEFWGKAGPPECIGYCIVSHTYHCKTTKDVSWHYQLLPKVHT